MVWDCLLSRFHKVIESVIQSKSREINLGYQCPLFPTILFNLVMRLLLFKIASSRSFVKKIFQTLMKILTIKLFLCLRLQMAILCQTATSYKFLYRQCQGTVIKSWCNLTMRNSKFLFQQWQDTMIKSSDSRPWSTRTTGSRNKKFHRARQGLGVLWSDQFPQGEEGWLSGPAYATDAGVLLIVRNGHPNLERCH